MVCFAQATGLMPHAVNTAGLEGLTVMDGLIKTPLEQQLQFTHVTRKALNSHSEHSSLLTLQPPQLDNQVLLRELRLDDNSICCLDGLAACWLPLLESLSVAQNR